MHFSIRKRLIQDTTLNSRGRGVTVVEGHLSFTQKVVVFQTLAVPLSPKNCASLLLNQSFEEDHFKNV